MSDNQGIRNYSAQASINDYEYSSNFKLGYFENLTSGDRIIEGVSFCMEKSYKEGTLNENKFLKCYQLRKNLLEKADKLNFFN